MGMADHSDQQLSAREMVRAHTYPLLAAISTISLLTITVLLIPQAVRNHRYNRCIDAQVQMRVAVNPQGASSPRKLNYLKAVEHCQGRQLLLPRRERWTQGAPLDHNENDSRRELSAPWPKPG